MAALSAWAFVLNGPPEPARAEPPTSSLQGRVVEVVTLKPVPGATIHKLGSPRRSMARSDGTFSLPDVPAGVCSLAVTRIGYRRLIEVVQLAPGDTVRVVLSLTPQPIEQSPIVVRADSADSRRAQFAGQTPVSLTGKELREHLGGTIAQTLAGLPGIDQRTMGPAPARPVLRGLSGNRLLLLEDGERTGDLSATSADHAVVIDPTTSETIRVVRGPAALMFGSNTLGGVIDVERSAVPRMQTDAVKGSLSCGAETAGRGGAGGLVLALPLSRRWASGLDLSLRQAGDIETPEERLGNSNIETESASLGLSRITDRGFSGASGSLYASNYGIPGGFLGGHPHGVDIRLNRRRFEVRGQHRPAASVIRSLDGHLTYSRYFHDETESNGVCGVAFGLLTTNAGFQLRLQGDDRHGHLILGGWGELRDYDTACLSFVPHTKESSGAAYAYGERPWGAWDLRGAVRLDTRLVVPAGRDTNKAGVIRRRTFSGLSAGAGLNRSLAQGLECGVTLMRTFNAPGLEELFADGPHLAAYSYEIGNADLAAEQGLGLEATVRAHGRAAEGTLTFFENRMAGFIYPSDTGELEYGAGEDGVLERYQYRGRDARMVGCEFSGSWRSGVPDGWRLQSTASYVRGSLSDRRQSLPFMPPLSGRLSLGRSQGSRELSVTVRGAARQDRLGEFESPTAGYLVFDLRGSWFVPAGKRLNTLNLTLENAGNVKYHSHLSRIKSVLPEPGRNLRLLWRMSF